MDRLRRVQGRVTAGRRELIETVYTCSILAIFCTEYICALFVEWLAMANLGTTTDERFAFFSREELLQQRCLLLEHELAEMGGELSVSREKIATLVVMWTGMRDELRCVGKELAQARWQLAEAKLPPPEAFEGAKASM